MEEECKALERAAKELEKDEPLSAIEKYNETADCFEKVDKPKNRIKSLTKSADIYRSIAKNTENPVEAYEIFGQSSQAYELAEKQSEAEKVLKEANKKLVDDAKKLRDEGRKTDELNVAEEKFATGATYAIKAGDTELANNCWEDSANQYRKSAAEKEDPRAALEVYKHAIQNFRKGANSQEETKTMTEAASKFYAKGESIVKTKIELVYAIDNFLQAHTLFTEANVEEKSNLANTKVDELCKMMGLPLDYVTKYFELKNIPPVSLTS
ncbi:MAG: hypothetical protein IH840_03580 [Candidatus Heimdallarchaeota archaeon]|nr:hypothetical protein [Candidatus Heimdallarchaeota archaeon]